MHWTIKIDGLVKSHTTRHSRTRALQGIRGNDKNGAKLTFYEFIKKLDG